MRRSGGALPGRDLRLRLPGLDVRLLRPGAARVSEGRRRPRSRHVARHGGLAAGRRPRRVGLRRDWSRARSPIASASAACSRRRCSIYSIGSLICGVAPTPLVFFLGRIVQGVGIGGEWAIGHGMLAEAVPPAFRGRAAAFLQAGEPFGVAIAAIVGYLVLPRVGWRAVLLGSSVTALLAVAVRASSHLPDQPSRSAIDRRRAARGRAHGGAAQPVRARVAARGVQAGHVLELLHVAAELPVEADAPEHRALADLDDHGAGRSARSACSASAPSSDRLGRRPAFAMYSLLTAAAVGTLAVGVGRGCCRTPALFWTVMFALGRRLRLHGRVRRAAGRALPDGGARPRRWARRTTSPAPPQLATPVVVGLGGRALRAGRRPRRSVPARAGDGVVGVGLTRDARHRAAAPASSTAQERGYNDDDERRRHRL